MTLWDEFNKAFNEKRDSFGSRGDEGWEVDEMSIALWAARWALEKASQCALDFEEGDDRISYGIKKLAKELS